MMFKTKDFKQPLKTLGGFHMKLKGSLPFYFNLLVIMMVTVVFLYDKVITYDKNLQISAASTRLYIAENSAEAMKRSIDAAVDFSGRAAIEEFGRKEKWDKDNPKMDDLKKDFSDKVKTKLDSFSPALIGKNIIEWGASSVSLNIENGIEFSGSKPFTLKTQGSNIITFSESGKFREKINSKFFNMTTAGRELFDAGLWVVSEEARDAGGDFCKKKVSGAKTDGFFQVKIENLLNTSLYCGYRSTFGLASFEHYNKAGAESVVKDILTALASDLGSAHNMQVQLTPEITETKESPNYKVTIKINFRSESAQFLVPIEAGFAPEKLEFFVVDNFGIPE